MAARLSVLRRVSKKGIYGDIEWAEWLKIIGIGGAQFLDPETLIKNQEIRIGDPEKNQSMVNWLIWGDLCGFHNVHTLKLQH